MRWEFNFTWTPIVWNEFCPDHNQYILNFRFQITNGLIHENDLVSCGFLERLFSDFLQVYYKKKGKREVYNSQIDLFRGTAIFRSRIVFEMRRRALTNPDERQISQ